MLFVICATVYILSGVLAYGITYAYFIHNPSPDITAQDQAIVISFGGVFGLLVALLGSRFAKHGIQYRRLEKDR